MATDVLGYLLSKGLHVKRAAGDECHLSCWWCNEPEGKRGRLYINVDPEAEIPGLFLCQLCGVKGALPSIQRHFGDYTKEEEQADDHYLRRAILAEATEFYHLNLADSPDAFRWLKNRGLDLGIIQKHQLGFASGGLFQHLRSMEFRVSDIMATGLITEDRKTHKMVDFLTNHITIPYLVSGNPVMIRGRDLDPESEKKYVTPFGQKSRLYNTDSVWHAEEIVLTEGELDCLVVESLGFHAVGVPGAGNWQDTWDGYFTEARRVYVVFDNDDAGRRGCEKVTDHLGSKARTVVMPEAEPGQPKNDPTEWVVKQGHTADEFAALLRNSAGGLLIRVSEAIREHAELQDQNGVKFGLEKLDLLIEPGLLPSQLMIPLARTGQGKTIFLINLFQRVCMANPEARVLFLSLEQTRGDWWERARRIYRFYHLGATDREAEQFWNERIMLVDRNRLSPEQIIQCVDDFTYEWGKPTLVGLDYLGYFARGYKGEAYERTSAAVMDLKGILKELLVPMIAPHQVNRSVIAGTEPSIDQARDSGVIAETADFVMLLWSSDTQLSKTLEERSGEFFLKIGKSRHGGVGHKELMWFAPLSLALVSNDEPILATLARNEYVYQSKYKEHWTQAQMRHEAGTPKDEPDWRRVEQILWKKRQRNLGVVA